MILEEEEDVIQSHR